MRESHGAAAAQPRLVRRARARARHQANAAAHVRPLHFRSGASHHRGPVLLGAAQPALAPDELYSFETFVGSDGLRAAPPPLFRRSLLVISREIAPPGSRLREITIRQLQIAIVAQTSGKEAPRKLIHARIVLEGISFAAVTSLDTWPVAEWTGDRHTGLGYDFESADPPTRWPTRWGWARGRSLRP